MDLLKILDFIEILEERNNQSISFMIHFDGSGCFCDFWDNEQIVISFERLEDLEIILKKEFQKE